jgi:site-specific DNA-adenine methylase
MSRLKPFFTYYGGKYRIAPKYPAPQHRMIIEPFAGSAGYSVTYPDRDVVLCDLNEKVCGTWDYLINANESDIRSIPVGFETVDDLQVPQEVKWLVGWWCNKGTTTPAKSPSKWMRDRIRPNSFWGSTIRERVASQVQHIRHWKVFHGTYQDLGDWDDGATWFVDPPYDNKAGSHYTHGSKGLDYQHLASWCRSRTGQVMVCENDGADWLPFRPFLLAKATPGKQKEGRCSKEAIWTNQET